MIQFIIGDFKGNNPLCSRKGDNGISMEDLCHVYNDKTAYSANICIYRRLLYSFHVQDNIVEKQKMSFMDIR